jgi:hypothetical protein
MLNVGKKRLLMVTVLLGLCVFAAGWAVLREFGEENVDRETVATTIHKLEHGEILQEVRPLPRKDTAK